MVSLAEDMLLALLQGWLVVTQSFLARTADLSLGPGRKMRMLFYGWSGANLVFYKIERNKTFVNASEVVLHPIG